MSKNEELFYIQNKGFSGNCLRFWKADRCGYTSNLDEAMKVSKEEAEEVRSWRDGEDTTYPVEFIDRIAHRHVNYETLRCELALINLLKK